MNKPNGIYKSKTGKQILSDKYDSVLQQFSLPYTTHTIHTQFGDTFLIECGQKENPPLFLLHGASSNLLVWLGDIHPLSKSYRVFAIDIIGEPGKSYETRLNYKSNEYASWLEDIRDGLSLDQVAIMGMSQGGWLALHYAITYPKKVSNLFLISPAGIIPTKSSFIFKAMAYSMMGKAGIKRLNQYVLGAVKIDQVAEDFMELVHRVVHPRFTKEVIFKDEELSRLIMSVHVIGGDQDVVRSNEAIIARMKGLLPDFTYQMIEGVGHVVPFIGEKVMSFLAHSH